MAGSVLNFNVGILGHIDSGKTSLAKALSTTESTASFDKNPQSKERGITLDLGFSSFSLDVPPHLKELDGKLDKLQYTLVDCPGHASLIRTIIGGANIIDLMILVVDVTKGMQTQTAECLIIGEITCRRMIMVLNKVDLLPSVNRADKVKQMIKKFSRTLEKTCFRGCPIIAVAANPSNLEEEGLSDFGLEKLTETLMQNTFQPKRDASGPFIYSVDHCFSIRGQGTIMTGTVLNGTISVNDTVEIAHSKETRKVKSMQMFKKPIERAFQGDRVALSVTQFDPKQLERGLVCSPGALATIVAALVSIKKIPHYKSEIRTKSKFHITLGHETVMAHVAVFGLYNEDSNAINERTFDFSKEYKYQECLLKLSSGASADNHNDDAADSPTRQYALLEFERPVICPEHSLVIGARLDMDVHTTSCRLAFHGRILEKMTDPKYTVNTLPQLHIYKNKSREGVVERKGDDYSVVCRGFFKKETNMDVFIGLKVTLSSGESGVIESAFGQSGKFKVRIPAGLSEETSRLLGGRKKKGKAEDSDPSPQQTISVVLQFKRYIFDPKKKMIQ